MKEKFWINQGGTLTIRDLLGESRNWDRDRFLRREGLDLYNFQWEENINFYDFSAGGSMYGVGGLRVSPGDVVVDIGANIGLWSLIALDAGASSVLSFEPVRLNYICLCLNTFGSHVRPYNLAIGDRVIKSSLNIHDSMGFFDDNPDDPAEDILTVTVDWLFDVGLVSEIDFLKIDIEGYEDRVLYNVSKDRMAKINKISMEYHNSCPTDYEDLIRYLATHGIKLKFRLDLVNERMLTFER